MRLANGRVPAPKMFNRRLGEVLRHAATCPQRTDTANEQCRACESALGIALCLRAGSQCARLKANKRSALGTQNFPDFSAESCRVLDRFVDQVQPLAVIVVELRLRQKIRGLHYCLDGITQIVRQETQSVNRVALQLLALFHCRFLTFSVPSCNRCYTPCRMCSR